MLSLFLSWSLAFAGHVNPCAFPEVVPGGEPLVEVGNWLALARHIDRGTEITTVDAAVAEVCSIYGWKDGCTAATLALCGREGACFVRAPSGSWFELRSLITDDHDRNVSSALAGDGRYLVVGLGSVWEQRIGDTPCFFEGDDEPGCGFDWGSYGAEYADYVIDLASMSIVWNAYYGQFDEGDDAYGCVNPMTVSVETHGPTPTFVRNRCDGTRERFEVAALAGCNADVRETARDAAVGKRRLEQTMRLIDEGRELTRARDFDEAIERFDLAMDRDGLARLALSGRGFARLLRAEGDDLNEARKDFDKALAFAPNDDTKFRAAVTFNLGLVAEKQKDAREAARWFEQSHALHPTAATRKKLGRRR